MLRFIFPLCSGPKASVVRHKFERMIGSSLDRSRCHEVWDFSWLLHLQGNHLSAFGVHVNGQVSLVESLPVSDYPNMPFCTGYLPNVHTHSLYSGLVWYVIIIKIWFMTDRCHHYTIHLRHLVNWHWLTGISTWLAQCTSPNCTTFVGMASSKGLIATQMAHPCCATTQKLRNGNNDVSTRALSFSEALSLEPSTRLSCLSGLNCKDGHNGSCKSIPEPDVSVIYACRAPCDWRIVHQDSMTQWLTILAPHKSIRGTRHHLARPWPANGKLNRTGIRINPINLINVSSLVHWTFIQKLETNNKGKQTSQHLITSYVRTSYFLMT